MKDIITGIEIDFSDHDSLCKLMDKHREMKPMLLGKNEDGEMVSVYIFENVIGVQTFQNNHWIRKNYYHRDGTVEELFEGKWHDN